MGNKYFTNILLGTILLLASSSCFAQVSSLYNYDLGGDDYANVMQKEPVGGSKVIVGSTNATGAGGYDAFLAKFDKDGAILWQKQYGGTGTEYGTNFIKTSDGNYLLVGRSNSFTTNGNYDFFAVKVDTLGSVLWSKTFGTDSTDYGLKVVESNDGGYLFLGQSKGGLAPKNNSRLEMLAIKTDASGNVLWSKTIGSINGNEVGYEAVSLGSDGYVIGGYSGINLIGLNDVLLVKLSVSGQLEMSLLFGGVSDDDARKFLPLLNGLLIAGNTRSYGTVGQGDIFVARLIVSGGVPTIGWMKVIGGAAEESLTSIRNGANNKFIITAHSTSFGQSGASLIAEMDTNGVVSWIKGFDGTSDEYIMDASFDNNQITTIGYSNTFGTNPNNLTLSTANLTFDLGCNLIATNLRDSFYIPQLLGPVITDFTADSISVNEKSLSLQTNTQTVVKNVVCLYNDVIEIENTATTDIYPNPANSIINLTFSNNEVNEEVSIFDFTGKLMKQTTVKDSRVIINIADLESGVYFLKSKTIKNNKKMVIIR